MTDLDNAKDAGRVSYANSHPDLRQDMPDQLRNQNPLRQRFDEVRDPLIAKQIAAMKKTEAQRREEGDGSGMVKSDKPFPELKPRNANVVKRQSFNQAWFREQRAAVMASYRAESVHIQKTQSQKSRERGYQHAPSR